MKVISKTPGTPAQLSNLEYSEIRSFIGGTPETVPFMSPNCERYVIVCNDSFWLNGSEFNIFLAGVAFCGNIFICKEGIVNGEPDLVGLDKKDYIEIMLTLGWSLDDMRTVLSQQIFTSFYN